MTIASFRGRHSFLSNFYPVGIAFDGFVFPTLEHAYQASKTLDRAERLRVHGCRTAGAAKALGRRVTVRTVWDAIRDEVMLALLRMKFDPEVHPLLAKALVGTGTAPLIEENSWGDIYWGTCRGVGENTLGKLLMKVRAEIAPKVIIT